MAFKSASDAAPFGDIFHGKDQQFAMIACFKLRRVEQHHPSPDNREGMLKFEVAKDRIRGNNVFEQSPQVRNVPLSVA